MSRLMSIAFFGAGTVMAAIGFNCSSADSGHGATGAEAPDYAACQNDYAWTTTDAGVAWSTSCDHSSCAADAPAAETLSRLVIILTDKGINGHYRFLRAKSVGGGVEITFLVVIDWFQAADTVTIPAGLDDTSLATWAAANLCLTIPNVVPYPRFADALSSCNPSIRHDVCSNGFRPQNGCHPVGGGPGAANPPSGDCVYHTNASADATSGAGLECDVNQLACP